MSKVPFVIIVILLLTAAFIVIFTRTDNKSPLAALGDVTPTPPININLSGNGQGTPSPLQGQQGQQQTQQTQQQAQQQVQGQQAQQQIAPTVAQDQIISATKATIHTVKGDIELVLYPDDAPKTVKNFATLAKTGYYNNLTFHRVEPGFVIQGGDPTGTGSGGRSIYGPTFEDELIPSTPSFKEGYKEGVLAMANRGPNTNSSQFFIMLADNDSLPKNYTIFGKVTKGIDVVKQIVVGDKFTSIDVE